jgi:hypothetical protein
MQRAALSVREVITLIVRNQVDNRTVGQRCRLVEDQPSLLDTRSERAHVATVRVFLAGRQAFTLAAEGCRFC